MTGMGFTCFIAITLIRSFSKAWPAACKLPLKKNQKAVLIRAPNRFPHLYNILLEDVWFCPRNQSHHFFHPLNIIAILFTSLLVMPPCLCTNQPVPLKADPGIVWFEPDSDEYNGSASTGIRLTKVRVEVLALIHGKQDFEL